MVSSYTPRNRLNKQATGDNTNTWGDVLNSGVFDLVDFAVDGWTSVTVNAPVALTSANGAADQARARTLKLSGTGGTVTLPAVEKWYLVWNAGSGDMTLTVGGVTTTTLGSGDKLLVLTDGVGVYGLAIGGLGIREYVDEQAFAALEGDLPGQAGNSGKFLTTDGSLASWGAIAGAGLANFVGGTVAVSGASASVVRTGTSTATALTPGDTYSALAEVALTDSSTIAVDMATGLNFAVTLGGNRILGNPTNPKVGQCGFIRIVQDGTGSRTLSYGSNWKRQGGAPVLTTTAGATDILVYQVITSSYILYNLLANPS